MNLPLQSHLLTPAAKWPTCPTPMSSSSLSPHSRRCPCTRQILYLIQNPDGKLPRQHHRPNLQTRKQGLKRRGSGQGSAAGEWGGQAQLGPTGHCPLLTAPRPSYRSLCVPPAASASALAPLRAPPLTSHHQTPVLSFSKLFLLLFMSYTPLGQSLGTHGISYPLPLRGYHTSISRAVDRGSGTALSLTNCEASGRSLPLPEPVSSPVNRGT